MNQTTIIFTFILGLCGSLLFWIMNSMSRVTQEGSGRKLNLFRHSEEIITLPRPIPPPTYPLPLTDAVEAAEKKSIALDVHYSSFAGSWAPTPLKDLGKEKIAEIKKISNEFIDLRAWLRVNDLLRSSQADSLHVAKQISRIPVLSNKILQTINSSYFGLPNRIDSVERAITLLGYDRLKAIILDNGLNATIGQDERMVTSSFNRQWIHAAAVATCAQHLAAELLPETRHDFYSIALLHDIGRYFLPLIKDNAKIFPGQHPVIQEEFRYGINHAQLGGQIITLWHMPEFTAKTVAFHHYPQLCAPKNIPPEYLTPAFILCLADIISKVLEYPGLRREIFPIRQEYFKLHNLDSDIEKLITPALIKQIDKNCRTMNFQQAA